MSVNDPTLATFNVVKVPTQLVPMGLIDGKSQAPIDYAVSLDGAAIYVIYKNRAEVQVYTPQMI